MVLNGDEYFTSRELAARYHRTYSRVLKWVRSGTYPNPTHSDNRRFLWLADDVYAWERENGGTPEECAKNMTLRCVTANWHKKKTVGLIPIKTVNNNDLAGSHPESEQTDSADRITRLAELVKSVKDKYVDEPEKSESNNDLAGSEVSYVTASELDRFSACISENSTKINALIKVVSILVRALKSSSGLLYGQIKAAGLPLKALENETEDYDEIKREGTDE